MGKILKELFREGDHVVFMNGFDRQDPSEYPNYLPPLPIGYSGWIEKVAEDFVDVTILHPLTGQLIQIPVFSPLSKLTNDILCTDSLKVVAHFDEHITVRDEEREGFVWDESYLPELFQEKNP